MAQFLDMDGDGDDLVSWSEFKNHFPDADEDVYKALSGMTRGYVDVDDARLEHAKWVEEIEQEAAAAAEEEATEKV